MAGAEESPVSVQHHAYIESTPLSDRHPPMPRNLLIALCLCSLGCATPKTQTPPNILFIAIDDLRPQLGAYGYPQMITPNLDRLADDGRLFLHHYTQVPTCGASRYALLTGRRPRGPEHLSNDVFKNLLSREEQERPESVAHLFRRNGYYTAAIGKISHYPDGRLYTYLGEGDGALEMPFSWDETWGPVGKWRTAWNAFFGYADGSNRNMERGGYPAYESAAVADTAYPDGVIAEQAIATLQKMKDQPFFLAVGFFKPHLPFTAPQKYWDLYDRSEIELSANPERPDGVADAALHNSGEMFGNYAHPEKGGLGIRIDDEQAGTLRHAYFASTSYVDAQVGKVLDELDRLGLRESTVVVVWGDHGWHLGDHTLWGKHSTFERALRSTLIIQAPEMNERGLPTNSIVESVDLYPTLADLAGLVPPDSLDGVSLRPLLQDPAASVKDAAYGYWHGRQTLRTDRYRITRFADGDVVLFDHDTDPLETANIAAQLPDTVSALTNQMAWQPPE